MSDSFSLLFRVLLFHAFPSLKESSNTIHHLWCMGYSLQTMIYKLWKYYVCTHAHACCVACCTACCVACCVACCTACCAEDQSAQVMASPV